MKLYDELKKQMDEGTFKPLDPNELRDDKQLNEVLEELNRYNKPFINHRRCPDCPLNTY